MPNKPCLKLLLPLTFGSSTNVSIECLFPYVYIAMVPRMTVWMNPQGKETRRLTEKLTLLPTKMEEQEGTNKQCKCAV